MCPVGNRHHSNGDMYKPKHLQRVKIWHRGIFAFHPGRIRKVPMPNGGIPGPPGNGNAQIRGGGGGVGVDSVGGGQYHRQRSGASRK